MIQKIKKATISVLLIGLMVLSALKPVTVYAEDDGYANENVIPGDESETNTEIKPLKVGDIKNIYTTATSKKKVLLRWSKAKNAKSYYVYKKVSGGQYRKVATTAKLSRSIEVTPGKKYGFKIIPFYQYKKTIIIDKDIGTEDGSEAPSDNTDTDPSVIEQENTPGAIDAAVETPESITAEASTDGAIDELSTEPQKVKKKTVIIKGKGKSISFNGQEIVSLSKQKYSYEQCEKDIIALVNKYHDYVSCKKIGSSVQGRNIYDIVLGNPDAKKSLLVVCELHAREYVTSVNAMKQIEFYLSNYNGKAGNYKVADILNKCCVHYVVMANPDGAMISQNSKSLWKANANGVDLNRNFKWGFISKGYKSLGTYTGRNAESEPESRAVAKLSRTLNKNTKLRVISYHSTGSIIFGDYAGSCSCKKGVDEMYYLTRRLTLYGSSRNYKGESNGNYREYCLYKLKVPCITLEVGRTSAPNRLYEYKGIFERNRYVVIANAAF